MFSALMHSVDVEFLKTHPLPLPFDTPEDITVSRDHTGTQYNIELMHIDDEQPLCIFSGITICT